MNHNIKQEIDKIKIPKNLHEQSKIGVLRAKSSRSKNKVKKIMIPLVASTFFVFSGIGAAYVPSLNHLVGLVSPEIAVMLQPIDKSSENNGIKMEVIAAMNDEEMAVIYATIQDLTGDRVDETLDLYDYSFTGGRMFTSEMVDFDEKTNTATLRIQGNGGEKLNNKKINLSIDSFLSHKETFESELEVDLFSLLDELPETVPLDMDNISGGGGLLFFELEKNDFMQVLKPNGIDKSLSDIGLMNLSNIGIIDNRLHIQVKWDEGNVDDHGYFTFKDPIGNEIYASTVYFSINEAGQQVYGHDYTEYIFDLAEINLDEQILFEHLIRNGNHIQGKWRSTFKLAAVQEEIRNTLHKDFGTWTANQISLSPLGVTLAGKGEINDDNIDVKVKYFDGDIQSLDASTTLNENDQMKMKFIAPLPLKLAKVQSIIINGEEITINDDSA